MPALMRGCRLKDIVNLAVVGCFFFLGFCERTGFERGRGRKEWKGDCWFYLRARIMDAITQRVPLYPILARHGRISTALPAVGTSNLEGLGWRIYVEGGEGGVQCIYCPERRTRKRYRGRVPCIRYPPRINEA
jgi:hypothetical protein